MIVRVAHLILIDASIGGILPAGAAQIDDGCMEDRAGLGLSCTANDVQLSAASNVDLLCEGGSPSGALVALREKPRARVRFSRSEASSRPVLSV